MSVKGRNFLAYLLLQANAGSYGNHHHDHSERYGGNGNFYYWRGYTTFMVFSSNESFRYKIV